MHSCSAVALQRRAGCEWVLLSASAVSDKSVIFSTTARTRCRDPVLDQVFRTRDEVIEAVLFVLQRAASVPAHSQVVVREQLTQPQWRTCKTRVQASLTNALGKHSSAERYLTPEIG